MQEAVIVDGILTNLRVHNVCFIKFCRKHSSNTVSASLLAKICISQVFWDPIKNHVSPRSALLKAVYLEAFLRILRQTKQLHFNFLLIELTNAPIWIENVEAWHYNGAGMVYQA